MDTTMIIRVVCCVLALVLVVVLVVRHRAKNK